MTDVQADPLSPLGALWYTSFDCSQLPTQTLVTYRDQLDLMPSDQFVWLLYHDRGLVPFYLWWAEVPLICYEIVEYHYPDGIRESHGCTSEIPLIVIAVQLDTNDMASVVIQEPFSSLSQMAVFAKKVLTIIRRLQSLRRRPRKHVPDRGDRGQPGRGAGGGCPPVPPFPGRHGHADSGHVEIERGKGSGEADRGKGSRGGYPPVGPFNCPNLDILSFSLGLTPPSQSLPGGSGTLHASPPPGLGFVPFQSPAGTSLGFSSFHAPPPPGTAGSSTPHQPLSQASSSDEEERMDDTDDVQHLGFGHRVGKKTTRFTPSDWP
ncbi:hypothetical protein M9H77_19232 [Catharanthus roseus]|uniref:Uncharacterized protein n=1 Tax=Catharanthus roseus TaxID=4058 RepID=A0ACC0B9N2_CATRO|nr:hypothetical protein M9H77_19232 [Catharanthus roseus]